MVSHQLTNLLAGFEDLLLVWLNIYFSHAPTLEAECQRHFAESIDITDMFQGYMNLLGCWNSSYLWGSCVHMIVMLSRKMSELIGPDLSLQHFATFAVTACCCDVVLLPYVYRIGVSN